MEKNQFEKCFQTVSVFPVFIIKAERRECNVTPLTLANCLKIHVLGCEGGGGSAQNHQFP